MDLLVLPGLVVVGALVVAFGAPPSRARAALWVLIGLELVLFLAGVRTECVDCGRTQEVAEYGALFGGPAVIGVAAIFVLVSGSGGRSARGGRSGAR